MHNIHQLISYITGKQNQKVALQNKVQLKSIPLKLTDTFNQNDQSIKKQVFEILQNIIEPCKKCTIKQEKKENKNNKKQNKKLLATKKDQLQQSQPQQNQQLQQQQQQPMQIEEVQQQNINEIQQILQQIKNNLESEQQVQNQQQQEQIENEEQKIQENDLQQGQQFQDLIEYDVENNNDDFGIEIEEMIQLQKNKVEKPEQNKNQKKQNISQCLICNDPKIYFNTKILQLLFNKSSNKIQEELQKAHTFGSIQKGICAKILKHGGDIGFKCLDCEKDNTCIICKECFENGNHTGHRVYIQQGCSGCCDCILLEKFILLQQLNFNKGGDIEAWKQEGFCKKHQGFVKEEELDLKKIPQEFQQRFNQIFQELFYQIFSMAENILLIQDNENIIEIHDEFSKIFLFVLEILKNICGQNLLLMFLTLDLYKQSIPGDKFIQHDCNNVKKFIINKEQVFNCSCTILDQIFKINFFLSSDAKKLLIEYFISMLSLYQFKQFLILTYTKMFSFLQQQQDKQKFQFEISKLMEINVQLFTSEELAILAIKSPYFIGILDSCYNILEQGIKNNNFSQPVFMNIFYHLRYSCMKPQSQEEFIMKPGNLERLFDIINILHFSFKVEIKTSMVGYDEQGLQDQFSYLDIDIIINDLIRQLFARIYISKNLEKNKQQIYGKILRIIITRLDQFKYQNKFSSILIPMQRYFALTLFSFLDFDINNLNNQQYRQILFQEIQISENQFHEFLRKNIKQVIQAFSFCKEIERKIWVFNGQEMATVSNIYFKAKIRMFNQDTLFLQVCVEELNKNNSNFDEGDCIFNVFLQDFSNKENWQILLKQQEKIKKMKKGTIENLEKYFFILGDFFSLLCYLAVDESSQFNIYMELFKEEPQQQDNFTMRAINIVVNYMQQHNGIELKVLREKLFENILSNKTNIQFLVQEIATFDKIKKQFKLKDEYTDQCLDQYIFYSDQILFSEFNEFLIAKYQKQQQFFHQSVLGYFGQKSNKIKEQIGKIAESLLNQEFFQFLKQFVQSDIFNDEQLQKKFSKGLINSFIQPALKLIYIKLEYNNCNDQIIAISKDIMDQIIKSCQGVSELSLNAINWLLKFINEKKQIQGSKIFEEQSQQQQQAEEKLNQKKEFVKKKQKDILDKFKKKAEKFSNKNSSIISESSEKQYQSEQNNCVICKQQLEENSNYGVAGYASLSNIFNFAQYRMHTNQVIFEQNEDVSKVLQIYCEQNHPFWELKKGNMVFSSCYHLIHYDCFNKYQERKQNLNSHQYEFFCPLCNRLSNMFITYIQSKNILENITENSLQIAHKKRKHKNNKKKDLSDEFQQMELSQVQKKKFSDANENQIHYNLENQINFLKIDSQPDKDSVTLDQIEIQSLMKNKPQLLQQVVSNNNQQIEFSYQSDMQQELQEQQINFQEEEEKTQELIIISKEQKNKFFESKTLNKLNECLTIFLSADLIKQNSEFLDIGIAYNQVKFPQNIKSDQFIDRLVIINIEETNSDLEKDYNMIILIENSIIQILKNIDLLGLQEFNRKQLKIYKSIYLNLLLTFYQFQSQSKNEFLTIKYRFIEDFIQNIASQKNRFLFQDIEILMLKVFLYMSAYFKSSNFSQIEREVLALFLFARIKQISAKIGLPQIINLDNVFSNYTYVKLLLPLLRKYYAFKSMSYEIEDSLMNKLECINKFDDDQQELQQLLYLCALSHEGLQYIYEKNKKCIEKWETNGLQFDINVISKLQEDFTFTFIEIEDRFGNLYNKYMQVKCDKCKDFSKVGELCLCLICGIILCSQKCDLNAAGLGNLNQHSCDIHCSTSAFLGLTDSKIYIVKSPKNQIIECTYFDQFGQPFQKKSKNWNDYLLDKDILYKVRKMIINDSVSQEISYLDIKTQRKYRENVF